MCSGGVSVGFFYQLCVCLLVYARCSFCLGVVFERWWVVLVFCFCLTVLRDYDDVLKVYSDCG